MTLYYNLDPDTGAAININDRNPATGAAALDGYDDLMACSVDDGSPVFPCGGPPGCALGGCTVDNQHLLRPDAGKLADEKVRRAAHVDAKTDRLIAAGFAYGGQTMSLSTEAQTLYSGMKLAADASLLTYPITITPLDRTAPSISLADNAAVQAFYAAAAGAVATAKLSGSALLDQIRDAADLAALAAIVDNR